MIAALLHELLGALLCLEKCRVLLFGFIACVGVQGQIYDKEHKK
jgi:hypothetical protein